MEQMTSICDMVGQIIQKKEEEKRIAEEQAAKDRYWKILICYDDDEDYTIAITHVLSTKELVDSLIKVDKHLDTIPETESDEFIKSSVENLVQNPSESEDKCECDVPDCDDSQTTNFSTYSNPLFYDSTSSDDESIQSDYIEDPDSTPKNDRFDTESYLLESLLNRDTFMTFSPKIDFLLEEFADELALFKPISPEIEDSNPEGDIRLVERLLYDNSSSRPLEEFNSENPTESFSPSPIPVEDSDALGVECLELMRPRVHPLMVRGDDDNSLFAMHNLPTPVSWLGSHTKSVIAAMASQTLTSGSRSIVNKPEPQLAQMSMDISGGWSGCAIWEVDLMDMKQYGDSEVTRNEMLKQSIYRKRYLASALTLSPPLACAFFELGATVK
ncbi:hypothetical protein Tco_0226040 [Tanacetum coccineum]